MPSYGVIKGDAVVNVIVADSKEDAELLTNSTCVEYTSESPLGVGWIKNQDTFIDPTKVEFQA